MSDLRSPASDAYPVRYEDSWDADDYLSEGDYGERECTHCGGEGTCDANADPLWDCDDNPHPCHACSGSGNRRDQRIF